MKTKQVNIRLSEKRLAKVRAVAVEREKTITDLVEDWIDRLPQPKEEAPVDPGNPVSF
jgi:hypothetical protein